MKKYFYLNEDEALKGIALVHEIKHEPILEYKKYFKEEFGLNVVEFTGENLPHYITYEKEYNKVREANTQEMFDRGEYTLTENQFILNGKIEEKPLPPKGIIKPLWSGKNWVESVTLEEFKELKRVEMKGMREHLNNSPLDYEKIDSSKISSERYLIDADEFSRLKISNAYSIFKGDLKKKMDWITADNAVVDFTIMDLEDIMNKIAVREQELFTHYATRVKMIANSQTLDEVKKIIW